MSRQFVFRHRRYVVDGVKSTGEYPTISSTRPSAASGVGRCFSTMGHCCLSAQYECTSTRGAGEVYLIEKCCYVVTLPIFFPGG
jgi:hypothetical protein